jgi:PAS domain S-box-containing protein
MKTNLIRQAFKIVLPYLIFGGLYIAFSDRIVKSISLNRIMMTEMQTYKGWGFIFLTSFLLFILLYRYFKKLENEKLNLEKSEAKWHLLVSNSPDFIALLDEDSNFLYLNKYAEGFNKEQVIGTSSAEFMESGFRETYKMFFKTCLETKTTQRFEFEGYGDNHCIRYYEEYLVPLESKDNELTFLAIARDITDRKNFEYALIESEAKYRTLFENMSEGFAYCKMIFEDDTPKDFIYLTTNPRFSYLTGLKNTDGKKVSELIPGIQESNPELFEIYGKVSLGGKPATFETFITGLNEWFSVSVYSPLHEHFVAVFTIVTERKQTELALQKNRKFLADLIEYSGALIFVKDLEGRYELVNKKWEAITGIDRYKTLGKTDEQLFPGTDGSQYRRNDLNVIKNGRVIESEEVLTSENGKRYFISIKFPTLNENGETNGICGISTEFTERKLAEEALRLSEAKYRTIAENMKDVVWILDVNTEHFTYISPSVYKLRGFTHEEIITENVDAALTPESSEALRVMTLQRINEFLSHKDEIKYYTDQVEQPCKDGSTVWTEVITNFYFNELTGHIEVHGVTRDITDRKKIQDKLKEREERYRSTLDSMLEGCQILDSDLRYVYINDAAEVQNHRDKSELLGNKYIDMWPGIESTYVFRVMNNCLEKKESHQFENEFIYPDGSVGWFDLSIQPVAEGIFILSVDITERKKFELEILKSREQLRALTARMEMVKEEERIHLSRELHDHLGQNLTGLKMDVAYVAKHLKSIDNFDESSLLTKIDGMVELIDDLIKNVRKISSELRPNVLDYLGLIPAIEWQIDEFKKRTEIDCTYQTNTSKIDFGDQVNSSIFRIIQEAFTNIIRHAKASLVKFSVLEQDTFIAIEIYDNGIGIKDADISDVKSLGILGMQERTLQFKGKLNIKNHPQGGTVLTLIIPKERKK